jgi:hypothetical protein
MSYPRNPVARAANIRCCSATGELPARSVKAEIADFFDGKTNGEELLHALYDHVLNEPIPHSMREMLRQLQRQVR